METNQITKLDDFRDIKYVYDIIGTLNAAIVEASVSNNINDLISLIREYIVECSSYMKNAQKSIEKIEELYQRLLENGLNKKDKELSSETKETKYKLINEFMTYQRNLRIEVNQNLSESGIRPKAKKFKKIKVKKKYDGVTG